MRSKALVLAAFPPVLGVWVPLREGDRWVTSAESRPNGIDLGEFVTIEVMDSAGDVRKVKLGEEVRGVAVRASAVEVSGVEIISVYLEEGFDS